MGCPSARARTWTCSRTFSMSALIGAWTPTTPVGARYSPNTSRSAPAHSPTVPPARAQAMVAGMRLASVIATARRSSSARATASASRGAPRFEGNELFLLGFFVDDEDRRLAVERGHEGRIGGFGEPVDTDHGDITTFDAPYPFRVALHQAVLHRVDHGERAATGEHPGQLGVGGLRELGGLGLHHV